MESPYSSEDSGAPIPTNIGSRKNTFPNKSKGQLPSTPLHCRHSGAMGKTQSGRADDSARFLTDRSVAAVPDSKMNETAPSWVDSVVVLTASRAESCSASPFPPNSSNQHSFDALAVRQQCHSVLWAQHEGSRREGIGLRWHWVRRRSQRKDLLPANRFEDQEDD